MLIRLTDKRREPTEDIYQWLPFESNDAFTSRWWDEPRYLFDDPWFVQVDLDGEEVARIELDESIETSHYADVPDLGSNPLELQFFEVAATHQRRGIGTAAVRALADQHPQRRLVAFSEEADEFWESLGWARYLHAETPHLYRPLFVQPVTGQGSNRGS